jgi:hypothetical protein
MRRSSVTATSLATAAGKAMSQTMRGGFVSMMSVYKRAPSRTRRPASRNQPESVLSGAMATTIADTAIAKRISGGQRLVRFVLSDRGFDKGA